MGESATIEKPTQTFPNGYPATMRRQLWPLCCGAAILSGFKEMYGKKPEEITATINKAMAELPDFQVYEGEQMKPKLTFLTLNSSQAASPVLMAAVEKAGFVEIGTARPRGGDQHFYIKDDSKTWKSTFKS